MATIIVTGGTGMIGKQLVQQLIEKGHQVIVLSRETKKTSSTNNLSYAFWDVAKKQIDTRVFEQADAVIHLAGANVAEKRWTKKRKEEIVNSRVDSGALLVDTIRNHPNKIKTLVSASAIGWYGPDPVISNPKPFHEDAPAFNDFLGETCKKWEAATAPLKDIGVRLVYLRTGLVLSGDGGLLTELEKPLRFGVAAIMGKGRQIQSWVHIDDLVRMYITAVEDVNYTGAYNAVAPSPVPNKVLVEILAKIKKGKFYTSLNIPSFLLKLVLGEMSIEVLKSVTVSCDKLHHQGFSFQYGFLEPALKSVVE